jgi:sugar lactone lactonase YvrE
MPPTAAILPWDVVYVDSGDGILGGCVMKVNRLTDERTILSHGGLLEMPFGVVVTREGRIVVTDCGRLIEVNATNGEQVLLTDIGCAAGLALDRDGNILIAGMDAILRYNLTTDQITVAAAGGDLVCVLSVVELPNGDLVALDASPPATLLRIHKPTGAQTVIARGGMLRCPQALVAQNNHLYVTDVATPDGNFGVGRILRIHAGTGEQEEVACGDCLVGPVGITLDANGDLIIGDPYTVNPDSPDLYDGGILCVDPRTGAQELICRGGGSLVNPRGVAVLPVASAKRAWKRH